MSVLVGLGGTFVLAGALLRSNLAHSMEEQFDLGLESVASAVANELELIGYEEDGSPEIEYDFQEAAMPNFVGGEDAEYFDLWIAGGEEYGRSPSLGLENQHPPQFPPSEKPQFRDLELPDGRPGRAIEISVAVAYDPAEVLLSPDQIAELPRVTCVVSRTREGLNASIAELGLQIWGLGGLALAMAVLMVIVFVRRGLAPLNRLSREVEQIDASMLDKRVQSEGVPDELSGITAQLNHLLERMQDSFAKERRMTAAMAHELRTPIAELRSASDVAKRWADDPELSHALTETAHDVSQRMSESVESIMRYCRLEAGQDKPELESIPVGRLLDELWRPFGELAAKRGVRFQNDVPRGAALVSDRGLLGIVFGNVLSNAASFASPGDIRACYLNGGVGSTVHISNEAVQLEAEDLGRMREAFWRKDSARSDGKHSGLGLTLVTSVSQVLGCRTELGLDDGRFSVAVEFGPDDLAALQQQNDTPQPNGQGSSF